MCAGDLNSSPHACVAMALTLSKPFPQSLRSCLVKTASLRRKSLTSVEREELSISRVLIAGVNNSTTFKLIEDLKKLFDFAHGFRHTSKVL